MTIEFSADFNVHDFNLLFESVDEWEKAQSELLGMIKHLKNLPPPPDDVDDDLLKYVNKLKDHYLPKERKAIETRKLRKERACKLKTKILLQKEGMEIDGLFTEASGTDLLDEQPENDSETQENRPNPEFDDMSDGEEIPGV